MIFLDENIDQEIVEVIEAYNRSWTIFSIRENSPGITDKEVIQKVLDNQGILVTEDKDFGELLFSYGYKDGRLSVIFLKRESMTFNKLKRALIKAIDQYGSAAENYFITIDKNKVRVTLL